MDEIDEAKAEVGATEVQEAAKTTDLAKWLLEEKWFDHYRWKWIALGAIASCPIYGLVVLGIAWGFDGKALADIGAIGDSFGALNTLFSGLALFGVIVTIAMQSRELELQRDELEQLTLESKRTADAQEGIQKLQLAEMQRANDIASDKSQPKFEFMRIKYYVNDNEINSADCHKGSYNPGKKNCTFRVKIWLRNTGEPIHELLALSNEWERAHCLSKQEDDFFGVLDPGDVFHLYLDISMYSQTTRFSDKLIQLSYLNRYDDRFLLMGYIAESDYGADMAWVGPPICIARQYHSGPDLESPV